jgi:glycosyltransferase involved in cell wall biosynthesis
MKVAWFGHRARKRGNGLVRYSQQTIQGLEDRGAQVVFLYHGSGREGEIDASDEVTLRSFRLWDHDLISWPGSVRAIENCLVSAEIDVAHVSLSFSNLDFRLPGLCHGLGIPVVATFHAPYDRRRSLWGVASRILYRLWAVALARYDAVVIFSQQQKQILSRCGVAEERIHIIPNGVDIEVFRPGRTTYKQEVEADVLIIYCGRLDPEKNVSVMLEVFSALPTPAGCKAVVIGDGVESERLRQQHKGERVVFTGLMSDTESLLRILQSGDIFVLPSEVEGLSIAMLEAMACGMATVATDVGADGEALGGAGIIIDPDCLRGQLHLALKLLIENPDLRHALGRKARRRVASRYSLQHNIDQLLGLYEDLLSSRARQPASTGRTSQAWNVREAGNL